MLAYLSMTAWNLSSAEYMNRITTKIIISKMAKVKGINLRPYESPQKLSYENMYF